MSKFPLSGFFLVRKPKQWTSFDVVSKVRSTLGGAKVGHAGTLDPNATGVLLLGVNRCTKMLGFLSLLHKEYQGDIFLGARSNTDDIDGKITKEKIFVEPKLEDIKKILKKDFTGKFLQKPPQFSAVKIGGKKSYELARKGKTVDIPPKQVEVLEMEVLEFKFPILRVRLLCTSGFYVRSLARDLGEALSCGAYLKELERTKIGNFSLEKSVSVEDISMENAEKLLLKMEEVSPLPTKVLEKGKKFFLNQKVNLENLSCAEYSNEEKVLLVSGNRFAIIENDGNIFKVAKVI